MQVTLEKIYGYVVQYGINFVIAVVIFLIGKWLASVISERLEKGMVKANMDKTLAGFFRDIIYTGFLVFVVVTALGQLGIQTTSFVAIIGAAGLAVGLALQGSLANFAAGVIIIMMRPFKVGDNIETSGASGVVKEIQIFNTILEGSANKQIIIPNAKITSDKIIILRS